MPNEVKLALVGLIPVVASIVLYYLDTTVFADKKEDTKQIFYGVVLGIVSILGTELGVPIDGAIMNVRDAAPLCAGLIFGGKAGIIAGIIGGVERYIAVSWGAGAYTQIACTIATLMAGAYAALLREFMFEDKVCKGFYGFAAGLITEISHMMMVFLTHLGDIDGAYTVLRICTIPMVIVNSFSVLLSISAVRSIFKLNSKDTDGKITISRVFQRRLLIVFVIAFVIISGFNYFLENQIANKKADSLISLNMEDTQNAVIAASDNNLLNVTLKIAEVLNGAEEITNEYLKELSDVFTVSEISVVNEGGVISHSTNFDYIAYDIRVGTQSKEFMILLKGDTTQYVQDFQPISNKDSVYFKYCGVVLDRGGFVRVGYNETRFYEDLSNEIELASLNRHIGESGNVIIADKSNIIVSDSLGNVNKPLNEVGLNIDRVNMKQNTRYRDMVYDVDSYYLFTETEGYLIIGTLPISEAKYDSELSIYLVVFMLIISFTSIFINIFFVIENSIVKNVKDTNLALKAITEGNLNTVVDVKTDQEFESLSNGINSTVDRLKELISEANKRIDAELKYAQEIQQSALPSVFPPFPERDEFDIYASMDAAKEVGGDFYDFYFVDGNKLVMLMADVSGKGIPAALFMMRAKTLMKSYAEYGISVNDVFTNANYNLCEGNEAGLFVTAWICCIDLLTGEVRYANAGHNPPLVKHANGEYEYLKSKAGFILGGMEGIVYKENTMQFEPGDELYLYTDGVTEAQNLDHELYGEERLINVLNNCDGLTCEEICQRVREDVDKFVGEADQFDDLTMLSFKYIKK